MNEQPVVAPPFAYTINDAPVFDPVIMGARIGSKVAFYLSIPYALVIATIFALSSNTFSVFDVRTMRQLVWVIRDVYPVVSFAGMVVWLVGVVPAWLAGAVGGGLLGRLLEFRHRSFPRFPAMLWNGIISLLVAGAMFGMVAQTNRQDFLSSPFDYWMWAIWYGPITLSFFAFWWIAYQVNCKFPVS